MNRKTIAIIAALVLGGGMAIACDGNDPVTGPKGPADGATEVTLHGLSRKGPGNNPPGDFSWTVDGVSGSKHFAHLGQFAGSHVTMPVSGPGVKVSFTVKAEGQITCDIEFTGEGTISNTGSGSCSVEAN